MSNNNDVRIERFFNAPIATMWQMWTDADHFSQWYGPQGMSIPVANMDVRVGGKRHICMEMHAPDRTIRMWFTGEYLEVTPTSRLVYTDSMADEHGNIMSPAMMGMPAGHPETTQVIVELAAVNGQTKMVLTHVGVPADSGGANGWAQAFDKLVDYIATV